MTHYDLSEIISKIAYDNSHKFFRILYFKYYDKFFRIAYYFNNNEEQAKECTLVAFERIWENRHKLPEIKDFDSYMFILIKNLAIKQIPGSEILSYNESDNYDIPDNTSPESELINDELFKIYTDCINDMPEKMRDAYIKVKEENMSYKAVASEMNVSEKTIDTQIQRAVKRLRDKINEYFN